MTELVYWQSLETFITNMFTHKPTVRYASILEISFNISLSEQDKMYVKKITDLIMLYINKTEYVDLNGIISNEKQHRSLILLLCKILHPVPKLKLYKRYKVIYNSYLLSHIEKLQAEILMHKNFVDKEVFDILKRYKVYKTVFKYLKKKIIKGYFAELSRASNKIEELQLAFKILNRENTGLINFKSIEKCFLNLYLNKLDYFYEISLTSKFKDLFNLYVRSSKYSLFIEKFEKCLSERFSFEYMLRIHLFDEVCEKYRSFLNKNEEMFIKNAHNLNKQPKKNLKFILDSLNQCDTFEKKYRTYLANKILRRENVDCEYDVILEQYKENKRVTITDFNEKMNTNNAVNSDVIFIKTKGKMVLRSRIFYKALKMIQNYDNPILDFRWPKYEELTFAIPPEISHDKPFNSTLSTLKLKIDNHIVICTLFQYIILQYVVDNYGNKQLLKDVIKKDMFECIGDKRFFFSHFLAEKSQQQTFYDHLDPICNIINDNLTFNITKDLNICPEFRLKIEKPQNTVQNTDYKVDVRIMKKLKKMKQCQIHELYCGDDKKTVEDRVLALEQKGYCTRMGDLVNYCP